MKVAIAATAAAFMLIAGSAQARAGAITGTVIAKHPRTGTFTVARELADALAASLLLTPP